jgi:hypothetical protein
MPNTKEDGKMAQTYLGPGNNVYTTGRYTGNWQNNGTTWLNEGYKVYWKQVLPHRCGSRVNYAFNISSCLGLCIKILGRPLFWIPWPHRITMPPSTVHENDFSHMPLEHLWEILERRLRQCFPPSSTKHQIYCGRMVSYPSKRVPDTCRIYVKVHWSWSDSWWPNALLKPPRVDFSDPTEI